MSVNIYDRKDMRGGGYAKRKFTYEEAEKVRADYKTGEFTQHQLASTYRVSQSIINKDIKVQDLCKDLVLVLFVERSQGINFS
tara:strand:+ start:127 stop:375 length:249 start_codon:yes stop_codon:yes gene_type:complete